MSHSTVSGQVGAVGTMLTTRRSLAWCRDHAPLLAAVAFFAAMFWPFMRKGEEGEWNHCFLRAADRLQRHEIINRPDEPNAYAYPPAMAMLSVPLAQLPVRWSLAAWYLVNAAAMTASVLLAWRLIGGPSLAGLAGSWSHVFWLGLFLASRGLVAPLENQQFDVVITACLFAGCVALARGHDIGAAIWLGLAAAMKCTPLLFAPYLAWKGKLRAAALMVLVAVAFNRLPDFLWPRADGGYYAADWVGTFLVKAGRAAPGVWESDLILNQSLSGFVNRMVQTGFPLSLDALPSALTKLPPVTTLIIRLLTYGLTIAMLATTAWRFGRPGASATHMARDEASDNCSNNQTAIEASVLVCLMLLLSPMSSKAHYVVLILPCLVLARAVVERRLHWKLWIPPLLVLGPLTAKGMTGKPLGDLMLAWGFPTWFAIIMLLAMWRLAGKQVVARQ